MPFQNGARVATVVTAILIPLVGFSQQKGTTGSTGSTGGSTGTIGSPSTGTPNGTIGNIGTANTNSTSNSTSNTQMPTPVFISGRVMLEDGTPPTEPVAIERVCINVVRTEGYTDSQGYFGVQLGDERGVFQDASEDTGRSMRSITGGSSGQGSTGGGLGSGNALSDRRFQNCDIRAKLAGFRSQTVSLAGHRALDTPDIGVILLHRDNGGSDEGTTVSMISLLAPKDAKRAFDKGTALEKKNNPTEAEKEFRRAVTLYPKFAAAWTEIGRIQAQRNEILDARQSFDQAIKCDPKFLAPFLQIALLDMQARKWQALADTTDRAIRLDPFEFPQIYLFNSVANYNLKNWDASERSIQAAAKLDTLQQFADISHLQGLLLIQRQNYPAAVERLRTYLKLAPGAEDAQQVQVQLTKLEQLIASDSSRPVGPKPEKQDK